MNIIGDIAGRYDTLMALLKKMPDEEVVSVGDMVDRGPKSKEVLDFFMKNGRAVLGNHEHMMGCEYGRFPSPYQQGLWVSYNGGRATLRNFGLSLDSKEEGVLTPYLDWIEKLPLFLIEDGLFISHAPISPFSASYKDCLEVSNRRTFEDSVIWNRMTPPKPMEGLFQVFGHNNWQGGEFFKQKGNKKPHALCLDKSRYEVMMGLHWPSMKIYEQEYID
jgi:serine/threonine protein phosphatase 1